MLRTGKGVPNNVIRRDSVTAKTQRPLEQVDIQRPKESVAPEIPNFNVAEDENFSRADEGPDSGKESIDLKIKHVASKSEDKHRRKSTMKSAEDLFSEEEEEAAHLAVNDHNAKVLAMKEMSPKIQLLKSSKEYKEMEHVLETSFANQIVEFSELAAFVERSLMLKKEKEEVSQKEHELAPNNNLLDEKENNCERKSIIKPVADSLNKEESQTMELALNSHNCEVSSRAFHEKEVPTKIIRLKASKRYKQTTRTLENRFPDEIVKLSELELAFVKKKLVPKYRAVEEAQKRAALKEASPSVRRVEDLGIVVKEVERHENRKKQKHIDELI